MHRWLVKPARAEVDLVLRLLGIERDARRIVVLLPQQRLEVCVEVSVTWRSLVVGKDRNFESTARIRHGAIHAV